MNPAFLQLLIAAAAFLTIAAAFYLAPEMSRARIFFSVTVPDGFRATPTATSALRRYRCAILISAAAVSMLAVLCSGRGLTPAIMVAGMMLQVTVAVAAWSSAHRRILPHSLPPPSVREASLALRRWPVSFQWWAWAGPIAVLLAEAAVLGWSWDQLPNRYPIHWGLHGHADAWAAKSPLSVLAPIIVGIVLCAFISTIAYAVDRFARHPSASAEAASAEWKRRHLISSILLGEEFLIASVFAIPGLAPMLPASVAVALIRTLPFLGLGGTVAILVACVSLGRKRLQDPSAAPTDLTPDACWKWGIFYVNGNDASFLVERRMGFGYTLNLAHPASWAILWALLLLPLVIRMVVLMLK